MSLLPEPQFDENVGAMLKKWRKEAGKTQIDIAKLFGTNRQKISQLEAGKLHAKAYTLAQWAHYTGHDTVMIAPEITKISVSSDNVDIIKAVVSKIYSFKNDEFKGLNFIFFGDHGSDLRAFIHLCTMYLHCPLRDRQAIAAVIQNCFDVAKAKGEIVCPDGFTPDEKLVDRAQKKGKDACIKGKERYYIGI